MDNLPKYDKANIQNKINIDAILKKKFHHF